MGRPTPALPSQRQPRANSARVPCLIYHPPNRLPRRLRPPVAHCIHPDLVPTPEWGAMWAKGGVPRRGGALPPPSAPPGWLLLASFLPEPCRLSCPCHIDDGAALLCKAPPNLGMLGAPSGTTQPKVGRQTRLVGGQHACRRCALPKLLSGAGGDSTPQPAWHASTARAPRWRIWSLLELAAAALGARWRPGPSWPGLTAAPPPPESLRPSGGVSVP